MWRKMSTIETRRGRKATRIRIHSHNVRDNSVIPISYSDTVSRRSRATSRLHVRFRRTPHELDFTSRRGSNWLDVINVPGRKCWAVRENILLNVPITDIRESRLFSRSYHGNRYVMGFSKFMRSGSETRRISLEVPLISCTIALQS